MEVHIWPLSKRKVVFLQGFVHFHVSWWEGNRKTHVEYAFQACLRSVLSPLPNKALRQSDHDINTSEGVGVMITLSTSKACSLHGSWICLGSQFKLAVFIGVLPGHGSLLLFA